MDFNSIVVSLVQGICEIIPVSSSACMTAAQRILHMPNITLAGKVALHTGSLIAIMAFFHREIKDIILSLFTARKKINDTYLLPLCLGTIPIVIAALYSHDYVKHFDNCKITGCMCIIFGVFLFLIDKFFLVQKTFNKRISLVKAFIIGVFQSISVISGVSRLGICITACRMLSFNRKQAVHFSLMLAIPSIFGSLCLMFTPDMLSFDTLRLVAVVSIISLICINPLVLYMERYGFFAILICRIIIGTILIL